MILVRTGRMEFFYESSSRLQRNKINFSRLNIIMAIL